MKTKSILVTIAIFVAMGVGEAQTKTIELFNGKDLSGWGFVLKDSTVKTSTVFTVEDGVIGIAGEPFGYMYTEQVFSNFHLHVEWRWPEEATNSGIFLLVQDDKKVWPNAIECQLKAGDAGSLVLLGGSDLSEFKLPKGEKRPEYPIVKKKETSSENPVGEWNSADITCEKGHLSVYINGILQNKGTKPLYKQGRIGLQSEGKKIQFRHVRVTPLN